MLNPSYAAIKQFQSQKSCIYSINQLKTLLRCIGISMSVRVESPTVWNLSWDILEDTLSGTLEVRVQPRLFVGSEIFEAPYGITLRLEEPLPFPMTELESRLIDLIKQSVETIL